MYWSWNTSSSMEYLTTFQTHVTAPSFGHPGATQSTCSSFNASPSTSDGNTLQQTKLPFCYTTNRPIRQKYHHPTARMPAQQSRANLAYPRPRIVNAHWSVADLRVDLFLHFVIPLSALTIVKSLKFREIAWSFLFPEEAWRRRLPLLAEHPIVEHISLCKICGIGMYDPPDLVSRSCGIKVSRWRVCQQSLRLW